MAAADDRESLEARQTAIMQELNDLKMQAFDVPGFASAPQTLSVEQIMEQSKILIKESDEIAEKLENLQLPTVTQLDEMVPNQVDTE
jgi:hypothetical protein